jgi:hypothetical protein
LEEREGAKERKREDRHDATRTDAAGGTAAADGGDGLR